MADAIIILGQDAYHLIRLLECALGDRNEPWAVKTSMVWAVSGALPKTEINWMAALCNLFVTSDTLADEMKRWGDKETYASVCDASRRSKKETIAQTNLENTTRHNGERYEKGHFWANNFPDLPNN